ncbi:MAG: CDP-glucose 4,6-dehydratase [Pseudomonadota bacterium]
MANSESPAPGFWLGKRVLVTGHTGFKGSWLCYWLHLLGARVTGYALAPATSPHLFGLLALSELVDSRYGEIGDTNTLQQLTTDVRPDVVFHLAAQAQVVPSYAQPEATFTTNLMGTVAVLDAVRRCASVRVCQVVTSDKCYAQPGPGRPFVEGDALGGSDPYSASKAAAEIAVAAYRQSFFSDTGACSVATVRAGNALGGGDWSGQRLLPNSVRALFAGRPIRLTQPEAVRPWQYVLEPLSGYLSLAQYQYGNPQAYAEAWNFGPNSESAVSVRALAQRTIREWGSGELEMAIPDVQHREEPELRISIDKARQRLEWRPAFDLTRTVQATVRSYRALYAAMEQPDPRRQVRALCADDIATYTQTARERGISWACGNTPKVIGAAG